jgi:hypothetical protein
MIDDTIELPIEEVYFNTKILLETCDDVIVILSGPTKSIVELNIRFRQEIGVTTRVVPAEISGRLFHDISNKTITNRRASDSESGAQSN